MVASRAETEGAGEYHRRRKHATSGVRRPGKVFPEGGTTARASDPARLEAKDRRIRLRTGVRGPILWCLEVSPAGPPEATGRKFSGPLWSGGVALQCSGGFLAVGVVLRGFVAWVAPHFVG